MSIAVKTSRTQLWLENLDEWSWPGQDGALAAEVMPPSWVPSFPPRAQPAGAGERAGRAAAPRGWQRLSPRTRRLIVGTLLGALAAVCVALAQEGQLTLGGLLGTRAA